MKMSKKLTKAIVFAACAVLLIVGSIAGTVAYLTSTVSIENTFTYGNVAITLNEAKYSKDDGSFDNNTRVNSNEYKLIPGKTYTKNATITIADESEDCYLYVKIDSKFIELCDTEKNPLLDNNWEQIGTTGIYYYKGTVINNEVLVIDDFTVSTSIENNASNITSNPTIVAYAVQKDGFNDNPVEAWNATFGKSA